MTARDVLDIAIEPKSDGNATVVTLSGGLDLTSAGALRDTLASEDLGINNNLVLDLRTLDYIDSAGLSVLIAAQRSALAREGRVKLLVASGIIERLLQVTGLTDILPMYRTLEDAQHGQNRVRPI